jgi:hypothetical protein
VIVETVGAAASAYASVVEAKVVKVNMTGEETTLQVVGILKGEAVQKLEESWRNSSGPCRLDLRCANDIDELGKKLIAEMFASGVELVIGVHPARVQ